MKQLPRNEKPERNVVYSKIGRRKEVTTVRNLKTELKRTKERGLAWNKCSRTEQKKKSKLVRNQIERNLKSKIENRENGEWQAKVKKVG